MLLERRGLPPDLHVGDPAIRSADPVRLPRGSLFSAVDGNPTQPGAGALPGHEQPLPPRTRDRRRPAHEAAPSRHEVGSAARHGRGTWGRRNGPEPRRSPEAWRRKSPALRGRPGGLIEAARRRRRAPRTRRTRTPVLHDQKPRRRSMTCERSRWMRHVSMNPLGFVTLSPTGRPSNRYGRRFSPSPFGRIPRETKSPASAVLRSAPADASVGAAPAFGRAFSASPRGTR
jgi:hypothetical protein